MQVVLQLFRFAALLSVLAVSLLLTSAISLIAHCQDTPLEP